MSECEHEILNWAKDMEGNRIYWCSACEKQIIISAYLLEPILPTLRAIRETFGENWAQIISKVAI